MAEFSAACSAFTRRFNCEILIFIISSGFGFAGYSVSEAQEVDRLARETATRQTDTRTSLTAHLAREEEQNEKVMAALGQIQSDIAVLKYRLDAR